MLRCLLPTACSMATVRGAEMGVGGPGAAPVGGCKPLRPKQVSLGRGNARSGPNSGGTNTSWQSAMHSPRERKRVSKVSHGGYCYRRAPETQSATVVLSGVSFDAPPTLIV